ncbi:MAG: Ig-like domain-containing protein, partial [Nitrososphaeraceae archaeon]
MSKVSMTGVAVFIILTSVSNSLNFNQIFAQPLLSSVSSIGAKTYDALSIEAVSNMNVKSIGIDGGQVKYTVSAADDVGNTINVICNHESGSILSIHMVTCNTPRLLEAVEDTTPPTVSVPNDMILEATGPDGRMANYNASATDIVDGILPTSCNPKSGSMFALGQTRVECTANDKAGNIGKAEFVITVRDTTPPETLLGNVTVGWLGSISYGDATPSVDTNFNFNGTDLVGINYYECRLDNGAWQTGKVLSDSSDKKINICTYTGIRDAGTHNFQVRAVDTSGNEDPNPPSFMWDIESPLKAVQGLILQVNSINPTLNLDPLLYQVVNVLSDTSKSNDVSSCYLLDSFMNEIKVQNMIGSLSPSDLDGLIKTTLAITDNIGCPPPIANAGSPQSVDAGTTDVLLNGSSSLYADNQASFSWKQIGGNPTVEIKNSESPKATFDAPIASQFSEGEKSTTLTFQLTVVGAGNLESTSITSVKVNALTTGAPETPTNTPPVAESQSVTAKEDTSASINLDATDKDGDVLTYSLKSSPSHGSLSSFDQDTGSVVYNPDSGYTGSDSFTFTASDETSTSNTGKVSIIVDAVAPEAPINPPPVP